nr:hypothetical protein [Sedimentibacter sp.]
MFQWNICANIVNLAAMGNLEISPNIKNYKKTIAVKLNLFSFSVSREYINVFNKVKKVEIAVVL